MATSQPLPFVAHEYMASPDALRPLRRKASTVRTIALVSGECAVRRSPWRPRDRRDRRGVHDRIRPSPSASHREAERPAKLVARRPGGVTRRVLLRALPRPKEKPATERGAASRRADLRVSGSLAEPSLTAASSPGAAFWLTAAELLLRLLRDWCRSRVGDREPLAFAFTGVDHAGDRGLSRLATVLVDHVDLAALEHGRGRVPVLDAGL
jgi:hypothetical protein